MLGYSILEDREDSTAVLVGGGVTLTADNIANLRRAGFPKFVSIAQKSGESWLRASGHNGTSLATATMAERGDTFTPKHPVLAVSGTAIR